MLGQVLRKLTASNEISDVPFRENVQNALRVLSTRRRLTPPCPIPSRSKQIAHCDILRPRAI